MFSLGFFQSLALGSGLRSITSRVHVCVCTPDRPSAPCTVRLIRTSREGPGGAGLLVLQDNLVACGRIVPQEVANRHDLVAGHGIAVQDLAVDVDRAGGGLQGRVLRQDHIPPAPPSGSFSMRCMIVMIAASKWVMKRLSPSLRVRGTD